MNVLLLALSTISGENLKCFEYQYGEDPCFDGYYQLEPIPKFLNEKLNVSTHLITPFNKWT